MASNHIRRVPAVYDYQMGNKDVPRSNGCASRVVLQGPSLPTTLLSYTISVRLLVVLQETNHKILRVSLTRRRGGRDTPLVCVPPFPY